MAERTDRLLLWIAAERSLRAAFLVAVGIVLLTHVHTNWGRVLRQEAIRSGLHPSNGGLGRLLRRVDHVSPSRVGVYGAIAVGYGVLEGVEAYGLWRRRPWAERLTVVATSLLFIPEVWELANRPGVFKVLALVVNAAIVAYLIRRLRNPSGREVGRTRRESTRRATPPGKRHTMSAQSNATRRTPPRWLAPLALVGVAALGLAACGGSSSKASSSSTTTGGSSATTGAASSSSNPGTSFSAASVPGLGTVVVDGRGRTVYLLTGSQKNLPCDDASGCTKIWPDLPLPDGTPAATAGPGLQQSLLGTMKLSDGETYPTYGGYLMYEFSGDTAPGQGHGQGIKSFGGTWYALSPSGTPVTTAAGGATNTTKSSSAGGY